MICRVFVLHWKRGTEAPLDLGFEAMMGILIAGLVSRAREWLQLDSRGVRAKCDCKYSAVPCAPLSGALGI
jgi:hypothetical protein